jgi:DivIVA domain-containing protein
VTLTAQDVHERQFRLVRQSTGYDIDEVDAFLEEVEEQLRRLQAELDAARAQGGAAEAGATTTPQPESAGRAAARILELAQRTADESVAEAQRHAERIRSEAQRQADRIRGETAALEARVTELRGYESDLRGRLRAYFHAEIEELRKVLGDV